MSKDRKYRSQSCYCPILEKNVTITTVYDTSQSYDHKYFALRSSCLSMEECNYLDCPIVSNDETVTKG